MIRHPLNFLWKMLFPHKLLEFNFKQSFRITFCVYIKLTAFFPCTWHYTNNLKIQHNFFHYFSSLKYKFFNFFFDALVTIHNTQLFHHIQGITVLTIHWKLFNAENNDYHSSRTFKRLNWNLLNFFGLRTEVFIWQVWENLHFVGVVCVSACWRVGFLDKSTFFLSLKVLVQPFFAGKFRMVCKN